MFALTGSVGSPVWHGWCVRVLLRLLGWFMLGSPFVWLLGLDTLAGLVRLPSSVGIRVVGLAGLGWFG